MGGLSEKLGSPRSRPRHCVGCGREAPKKDLMRVVRSPDGVVRVDVAGCAPGRGAYLCVNAECIRMAMKKNALTKALKHPVDSGIYAFLKRIALERGTESQ